MATPVLGMLDSFDISGDQVPINIDTAIFMLSPNDTPLLTGMGTDGLSVLSSMPTDQTRFVWMEEGQLTPRSSLLINVTATQTTFHLQTGHRERFSTGDRARVSKVTSGQEDVEIITIDSFSGATDIVVVTRGVDSTTALTAGSDSLIIGTGVYLAEGSDPEDARSVDRDEYFNYTRIYGPTKVNATRTERKRNKYGVNDEMLHQLNNRVQENAIQREQAILYEWRSITTSTGLRSSGGIHYWLEQNGNIESTAIALTVANIETEQATNFDSGGVPDRLIANPKSLATINDIADTDRVRVTIEDPVRGRVPAMGIYTEYGVMTVVRNRWVSPRHAFMITREGVTRRIFDPLLFEPLAKTGDADQAQIVCEEGIQLKGGAHMTYFDNLTQYM
jgi:hypothetical protein